MDVADNDTGMRDDQQDENTASYANGAEASEDVAMTDDAAPSEHRGSGGGFTAVNQG
jgi:hypothetical protein